VIEAGRNPRFLGILSRYLVGEFLRILGLCVAAFLVIYVIVDFFDRFDDFIKHGAAVGSIVRYFLFKIPLIVTQVLPVAVLASLLFSLGLHGRNNETTAMKACGFGTWEIAAPLLGICLVLSFVALFWNETVVPHFSRRARTINTVEIKKKQIPALLGDREIWTHGEDGFYNIESFDARRRTLVGLSVYRIGKAFELASVVRIPRATWDGRQWVHPGGTEERFLPSGELETRVLPPGVLELREKPSELVAAQREAEELSYFELRQLIEGLRRKGLDPTEYEVDLQLKLSVPFIVSVMGLIAVPVGLRQSGRSASLAASIGRGLVIGFSFWFVLALAVSLGRSGAIPPAAAAWTANVIFGAIGLFLLLGV
jgi:lipopolysaccharide export system permease protein